MEQKAEGIKEIANEDASLGQEERKGEEKD